MVDRRMVFARAPWLCTLSLQNFGALQSTTQSMDIKRSPRIPGKKILEFKRDRHCVRHYELRTAWEPARSRVSCGPLPSTSALSYAAA